jgi:hypothetical protein
MTEIEIPVKVGAFFGNTKRLLVKLGVGGSPPAEGQQ